MIPDVPSRESSDVDKRTRCPWAARDPLLMAYHDHEWGVPLHNDRALFEFLILEGAQAGLSWSTILRKRPAYREAFDGFNPHKIAEYDESKLAALLSNAGIVRNRLKIQAAVTNARAFIAIQKEAREIRFRTSGSSSQASPFRIVGALYKKCLLALSNRTR